MKKAFRSAVIISLFTLASQLVLFACQLVAAAQFGAGSDMDAFLAASTLPQFLISVLLGSLSFVFIPFYVDYSTRGDEEKALRLSVGLFNNCISLLAVICFIGVIFSRQILEVTNPGLSPDTLNTSVKISMIMWPTVLATGAFTLLSSIYQAKRQYSWQATVPFLGALFNFVLLIYLAPRLGIFGLAIATMVGVVIQAILLLGIFGGKEKYSFRLYWREEGLRQILQLAMPLILVALITKFTPLMDRFLASDMQVGSISHLNYAFRIAVLGSVLITTGISTVIFPKMAEDVSRNDLPALSNTMSFGLRIMWAVVAPAIAIGIAVSLPAVIILLCRGEFGMQDAIAVSDLLKIYLLALAAMCLGNLSGKGFYALRDTKTLAIFGALEALAYVFYTVYLTRLMGTKGIAIGYVIYFSLSLLWQIVVLQLRLGEGNGLSIFRSFGLTAIAASVAGIAAVLLVDQITLPILQLIIGGLGGLAVYIGVLYLFRSSELKLLSGALITYFGRKKE